ncbi:MAG: right-handed parallel beta-helix repeat-containing protein, partial [Phycisphaerae bacterium]|nr:right-handed parallel beta-helix repeat-containing protein [Phycisphaerae bacterium]
AGHEISTIDGFTIRNGSSSYGGGIYCYDASPTIANNTITGNSADDGGGIYCSVASPTIANNTITGNFAGSGGGGIWCVYASPTIANNTIAGNSAGFGGGIECWSDFDSSPTISNNTIMGNSADHSGGGISCDWYSYPTIANNTITGNSASYYGGGICCSGTAFDYPPYPTIANNTITGNFAGSGGGIYCEYAYPTIANTIVAFNSSGIYKEGSDTPVLRYNCVFGNTAYNYSGVTDPTGTDGNISTDPLFVETPEPGPDSLWGTADDDPGDVHLPAVSPCVDAGDKPYVIGNYDLDGNPRVVDGDADDVAVVDMGAYEYQVDCNLNGQPDAGDILQGLSQDADTNGIPDECEDTSPLTIDGSWYSWKYHGKDLKWLGKEFPQTPQDRAPVETRQRSVTELTFRFSKPINPNTFDRTKVMVCGNKSIPGHPVDYDLVGTNGLPNTRVTLRFAPGQIPNGLLQRSQIDHYVAVVSDTVTDLLGNPLGGDRDVDFAAAVGNVRTNGLIMNWRAVNPNDYSALILAFSDTPTAEDALVYDLNADGVINTDDSLALQASYTYTQNEWMSVLTAPCSDEPDTTEPTIDGSWYSWHNHGVTLGDLGKEFPPEPQDRAPVETRLGSVATLTFDFDEPVAPSTFNASKVSVCGNKSVPGHPASYLLDDGPNGPHTAVTLTFGAGQIPNGYLRQSQIDHYIAVVSDSVTDRSGNPLGGDRDVNFAAAFGNVRTAGLIQNWRAVNPNDRSSLALALSDTPTAEAAVVYDINADGIIDANDAAVLEASYTYSGEWMDETIESCPSAGDTTPPYIMGQWLSWHNHGEALGDLPKILPQAPQDRAPIETREGSVTKLTFLFSEPIDAATFDETKVTVCGHVNSPGQPIDVSLDLETNGPQTLATLEFAPDQIPNGYGQLSQGDHYVIVISDTVTDLAGNPLSGDRDVDFAASFGNVSATGPLLQWQKVNTADYSLIVLWQTDNPTDEQALAYDVFLSGSGDAGKININDVTEVQNSFTVTGQELIQTVPTCP